MPSQCICFLLPFSLFMMGCFTGSSITKEALAPDDRKVFFYLEDGSYIKSFSGKHHRLDSGYQIVVGEIVRPNQFPKAFHGVVKDAESADVKVESLSIAGTILGCVLGGIVIAYPVVFIMGASWFR